MISVGGGILTIASTLCPFAITLVRDHESQVLQQMVVQKNISLSNTSDLFLAVVKTVPEGFGDGLTQRHH